MQSFTWSLFNHQSKTRMIQESAGGTQKKGEAETISRMKINHLGQHSE